MEFVKIENDVPVGQPISEASFRKLVNKCLPVELTPEVAACHGYGIYQHNPKPFATVGFKMVELDPVNIDGVWRQTWGEVELSPEEMAIALDAARAKKRQEIEDYRDILGSGGVEFIFPAGVERIQLRNATDERNVLVNGVAAQILCSKGLADREMAFRDADNTIHALTAAQMVDMALYVFGARQEIYTKSWEVKAALDALETLQGVVGFDVQVEWNQ